MFRDVTECSVELFAKIWLMENLVKDLAWRLQNYCLHATYDISHRPN
jgi:hypothetical protein